MDAGSGQASSWRVDGAVQINGLTRVGGFVVATYVSGVNAFGPSRHASAYDIGSGELQAWNPQPYGSIGAVAAVPEGVALGGDFNGIDGVARQDLASFDLDTGRLEPWTAALPQFTRFERLDTDGTFLFGMTREGRFSKIDPVSGAVLGSIDFGNDVYSFRYRVAGDRIVVAVAHSVAPTEIAVVTVADWGRQTLPVTLGGPLSDYVSGLEVVGQTIYLAGLFTVVNGASRPFLAAVDLVSGALLPFDPAPEAAVTSVRWWNGRLVVAGAFRRIGGARRRGLAELDPATGAGAGMEPRCPWRRTDRRRAGRHAADAAGRRGQRTGSPELAGRVLAGHTPAPAVATANL